MAGPELRPRFDANAKQDLGKWHARRRLAQILRRGLALLLERDVPEAQLQAAAGAVKRWTEEIAALPRLGYALFRDANVLAAGVMAYFDKSPIIGLANPLAPPVVPWQGGESRVEAHVIFGSAHEGSPGCVHGGLIAAAFDEVLSFTQPATGPAAVTANLSVRYLAPTPIERELIFEAELVRSEGRKLFAAGRCRAGEKVTAEAEALFVRVSDGRFEPRDGPE